MKIAPGGGVILEHADVQDLSKMLRAFASLIRHMRRVERHGCETCYASIAEFMTLDELGEFAGRMEALVP